MIRREKRTDTWFGLGILSTFEIEVRAHGIRSSGNRQIYGDEKFGVGGVDGTGEREIRRQ